MVLTVSARTTLRRLLNTCLLAIAGLGIARDSPAQAVTLESRSGVLTVTPDQNLGLNVASATQRRVVLAAADRILAVLRRDAALAKPLGYNVTLRRVQGMSYADGGETPIASLPPHFGVQGGTNYLVWEDDGRGGQTVGQTGGMRMRFLANAVGSGEDVVVPIDKGAPVIVGMRRTGEFRDHPVYNGECVLITKHARPPFVPVTKERYLRIQILAIRADSAKDAATQRRDGDTPNADAVRQHDREKADIDRATMDMVNEIKKTDPAKAQAMLEQMRKLTTDAEAAMKANAASADQAMQQAVASANTRIGERLQQLQAELDGLSGAERTQPMAVFDQGRWDPVRTDVMDINDPESSPLVELNPAFYDRSVPADVPQLIWACIPHIDGAVDTSYERLAEGSEHRQQEKAMNERMARDAVRIRDGIDWAALEALVRP